MLNTQLMRDQFGQFYKIQTQKDRAVPKSLQPELFSSDLQAKRFIDNLVVPTDYWKNIYLTAAVNINPLKKNCHLDEKITGLLKSGKIKVYKVVIPSFSDNPPEKRTVLDSKNNKHIFSSATTLLVTNPKEVLSFTDIKAAKKYLSEVSPEKESIETLAKELDLQQTQSVNDTDVLLDQLATELASGELVVIVDRYSAPSKQNSMQFSSLEPGNRMANLGPGSPAPAPGENGKTPNNINEIRSIASKSPTLTANLTAIREKGWKVTKGTAGKGSYADKNTKTITIDANEFNNPASYVQTIAHETGHALYTPDPYVSPEGLTKQEYIEVNANSSLKDEGEATLMNIQVRDEIINNNGPDIGIAGTQGSAYEKSYKSYQEHGDREKARTEIGNIFANNERPSTDPNKTYKEYYSKPYEDYWDSNVK